jgi:hypothetical protein
MAQKYLKEQTGNWLDCQFEATTVHRITEEC